MNKGLSTVDVVVFPDGRMDTQNAAAYCGLSTKTLAMKRCDGTGPKYVKLGRIFYFQENLDEWLGGQRFISTTQSGKKTKR